MDKELDNLRKSLKNCSIHRNPGMIAADYDSGTAYARGRVVEILRADGYRTIVPGKYLPAFDLIRYCEQVPYTIDVYALKYHKESKNVIVDEIIVDIRRTKFYGLTIVPYDMDAKNTKAYVEHANDYKKRMICSQYNIDPDRYIMFDEEDLFSKQAKPTTWIFKKLTENRCADIMKSAEELYVELNAWP